MSSKVEKTFRPPYFFKPEGERHGAYIRVGATTRKAEPEKIRELMLYSAHKSYDEIVERGVKPATKKQINELRRVNNDIIVNTFQGGHYGIRSYQEQANIHPYAETEHLIYKGDDHGSTQNLYSKKRHKICQLHQGKEGYPRQEKPNLGNEGLQIKEFP